MVLDVNLKVNKEKGKSRLLDNMNEREEVTDRMKNQEWQGQNYTRPYFFTVITFWKMWKGNFILSPMDQDD